jgi:hypothetical protein
VLLSTLGAGPSTSQPIAQPDAVASVSAIRQQLLMATMDVTASLVSQGTTFYPTASHLSSSVAAESLHVSTVVCVDALSCCQHYILVMEPTVAHVQTRQNHHHRLVRCCFCRPGTPPAHYLQNCWPWCWPVLSQQSAWAPWPGCARHGAQQQ